MYMKLPTSLMCHWNVACLSANGEKCVPSVVASSHPWSSSRACNTRQHAYPQLWFSVTQLERMFWHLLPGPVVGGQVHRAPPIITEQWEEKKALFGREKRNNLANHRFECEGQVHQRIRCETTPDVFRGGTVRFGQQSPDKAEFSDAIAAMDRIMRLERRR